VLKSIVVAMLLVASSHATIKVVPTTTLQAETGNNTSAANTFHSQSNGNLGSSNISKADIHSLLFSGATTKIYVHLMPWFGSGHHMNVGYSSNDPVQVHKQILDMISRGIAGVMIDWYGPGSFSDQVTKLVMAEAESHPGFSFAIVIDKGALKGLCSTCSAQDELARQLQYIAATYFASPAYMRWNGRPVVANFDLDRHYTIDWSALALVVPGNPAYLFQNSSGFSHVLSSGSYSWVGRQSDFGVAYLGSFYGTSLQYPTKEAIGSAYKGFNDTLASWSLDRVLSQQCGQTWLTTFSVINHLYSPDRQLNAIQLVTWNDYEEGTEIESGIDNCFSISANLSGHTLKWAVRGNESTLDHYEVYVSTDGNNLMKLDEVSLGNFSLNLASYALARGKYVMYVKAVGKPSILNHMSGAVTYDVHGSQPSSSTLTVQLTPTSMMLDRGSSGTSKIVVMAPRDLMASVFSCDSPRAKIQCVFSNPKVSSDRHLVEADLTIESTRTPRPPTRDRSHTTRFTFLPGLGFLGLVLASDGKPRRKFLIGSILLAILLLSSCGGGALTNQAQTMSPQLGPVTVPVYVSVASGGMQGSATIQLTLRE